MRCDDCLLVIEEYFDNELNEQQAKAIETHLFICQGCSKEYKRLEAEQKLYSGYQRNIAISPYLRSRVETELADYFQNAQAAQKPKPVSKLRNLLNSLFSFPHYVPAAVALALISVTVITTILVTKHFSTNNVSPGVVDSFTPRITPTPTPEPVDITEDPIDEKDPVDLPELSAPKSNDIKSTDLKRNKLALAKTVNPAQQLIKEAEEKYLAAITILSKDAQKNYQGMSPKLKASFDKSLKSIDENIAQTRRAIRQNPKDPIIAQYMLAAYAKKVEVLREIVTIDQGFSN